MHDASVLDERCDAGRQLHDRVRRSCLRPSHLSEGAFDRVHTRDRLGETVKTCGRRRGDGERDRVRVASSARPAGSESGSWDGLSVPGKRVVAGRLRATPSDDRREVVARLDGAPEVGRRGIGDLGLS